MNKLVINATVFLSISLASTSSLAGGSKGTPPQNFGKVYVADGGSKGTPPAGSLKVIVQHGRSKGTPPQGGIVATDSGASTLSHLLSKYFGF